MFCSALPARSATVAPALRLHQRRSSSTRSAARVVSMAGGPVVKRWKVDAAAEGCTGIFWRVQVAPGKFQTDNDPRWPRNGFIFEGIEEEKGWVKCVDNGKWLPMSGHGYTYLHEVPKE